MQNKPTPSSGCASHDNGKKSLFSINLKLFHDMNISLPQLRVPACSLLLLMQGAILAQPPSLADSRVWLYLTTDLAVSVTQGWGETRTDASISGRTISIAGQSYEKGLGTHAPGELVFKLDRRHKQFFAEVGVDDQGGPTGSVLFKVLCDGKEAFNGSPMKFGQAAKPIALDVTGVAELRLVVTDGGDGVQGDHADWANAAVDDVSEVVPSQKVPQFSTAGFFAMTNSQRSVFNFNPGWRFLKADAVGAEKPEFDDSSWEVANLPHGLEILGENESGCRNYQGPAWYRKRFSAAPPSAGGKVFVYFESVMGKCAVWVNGQKVAEHFGGYLPLAADITAFLRPGGQDNVIAARADNSDDPTYPPGKPQNNLDFTYLGGIYRDTYLIIIPAVHVTLPELSRTEAGGGVFVGVKDVNDNDASLEVRTEIANASTTPRQITLRSVLETAEGQEVLRNEKQTQLAAGVSQQMTQSLEPKNVRLWHPSDPYLHFIRTEVVVDGKVVDSLRTRFGIRLFEMRVKDGFFVNKKFIGMKLNGVNRHQDFPFIGNALPNSGQWRDVKLLREGGVNAIRAAHYPQDPAFYDACDELGMLVTTANPGWQFFNTKDAIFEQRIYEDTHNLVRRDRNHPSILLWETALNETPDQPGKMLGEMHRIAHAEYPFPGMFTVADPDEAKKGGLDFYYHGGFNEPKNSFTREYGDGGEVDNFFSHNATTRVKRDWGEGPLLKQAAIRAHDLDDCFGTPPIRIGAALWCGIDHQRGYHPDPFWGGLLDAFRVPRYSYYLFQSQYDSEYKMAGITTGPMIFITHELTQSSDPDVIIYSNCEEVRLIWLGKLVGTQRPDVGYRALPRPPFTFTNVYHYREINTHWRERTGKIEMIAEGLIGGKVVVRQVKKYPERTTAVKVTVDDAGVGLSADGSDFVPVRATIVDNKGVPKVLAEEFVYFEVEGPGEIISSSISHTVPAHTEFGTATVLLRAKTTPGVIRIKAHVQGLKSGDARVVSLPPTLPLAFDASYIATSKPPATGGQVVVLEKGGNQPADMKQLKEQVIQLQRQLTSKEQDLMELRSKVGK
jgi:beta-galactosidase